MIKFPFIPQMRKELHNSQQNHPSFDSQKLLNKMMFITLFDNHPDAVFMVDVDGEIIHFNNSVKLLFGYTDQTIVHDFERYFFKEDPSKNYFDFALQGEAQNFQAVVFHKSERSIHVDITYIPLMNPDMQVIAVCAIAKDITMNVQYEKTIDKMKNSLELAQQIGKMTEQKLHESERRFEHIYENLSLGIRSLDVQKREIILLTPAIEDITGYPPDYFYQKGFWEAILHPDDRNMYLHEYAKLVDGRGFNLQYRIIHKHGEIVWVQDKTLPVFDDEGTLIRIDGIVSNISDQKEYEKKIKHLAYHDSLTDLPNRKFFEHKIESLIEKVAEKDQTFSIMYLNLDRFRNINNTLGQVIGDKLLQQFSHKIHSLLPHSSLFSRFGGDEFGIVLWDYDEQLDYPEAIAKTMLDGLNEPFMIEEFELFITASIGISTYLNGTTVEEITKNADAALYRAKAIGKNNYQIHFSTLNIMSFKQYELERDLRKAIENNQLVLHFQPRVDTLTGKIVSAEALVRWEHPEWGLVSPGEFISLAEENGFINDISDWVLTRVCHYISDWNRDKLPVVPISINVATQRFLRNDWISALHRTLTETNVDPTLLEVEITETTLIQHEEIVEYAIRFLKELGIKIALDDFGTGYSSLSHIMDFSIDTIKIDQSFIRQITKTTDVEMIIKSIIFMAKGLGMNVVAEGVETTEQLAFLKQQECHEIQGYIFSKPIPEEMFQLLLKQGMLKPIFNSNKPTIQDRRNFYRIHLLLPLRANMTLVFMQGKQVRLGKTEVLIEDLGPGGLKFLSTIQLPVRPDIVYQFEMTIMNQPITVNGHIAWKTEVKGMYQYGLQFLLDENERDFLVKLLNNFSLQLKKNPFVPDCSFIEEDKFSYLKKRNTTEKDDDKYEKNVTHCR